MDPCAGRQFAWRNNHSDAVDPPPFRCVERPHSHDRCELVSWIVGTVSDRNAIPFADGSGLLFLEPACSSLTNVSLAMLCGVLFVKLYDQPWSPAIVRTIFAACMTTVAINVVRISLIGILPAYYDVIHGRVGATLAEWITNFAVVAIYAGGVRHNAPAHA